MKYLLIILLFSCTNEQLPTYTPVVETFINDDLVFFNAVNEMRLSRNIAVLKGEKLLNEGCLRHASYMSVIDSVGHDFFWQRYVNSKADKFGELVAYNYATPLAYLSAYETSPEHLNVLINPIYTHIGIGKVNEYQCVNLASYK